MIADRVPPDWEVALPDLRTRMAVTPVARMLEPDDELFRQLIDLHFADRGLHIPREALRFMAERIQRDYWTAERAVEASTATRSLSGAADPADDPSGAGRSGMIGEA